MPDVGGVVGLLRQRTDGPRAGRCCEIRTAAAAGRGDAARCLVVQLVADRRQTDDGNRTRWERWMRSQWTRQLEQIRTLSLSLFVSLCVCLSLSGSHSVSLYLFISLFFCLCISVSVYLRLYVSFSLYLSLSICMSVYMSLSVYIYPSVSLSEHEQI